MIGQNEVRLIVASVREAVQDYLNKDVFNPKGFVEVIDVKFKEGLLVCIVKGRESTEDKQ
jgi:hypothetical protein